MAYALISGGAVVAIAADIPAGSLQAPRGAKPYWLQIVDVVPAYDADTEVLDEAVSIGASQVTRTYTKRARTADEWTEARVRPMARIEAQFRARVTAPISYLGNSWHADAEAVTHLSSVLVLIASGVAVSDPRPWYPRGLSPVDLTHAQLVGLLAAITARSDALMAKKKVKQAEVLALASVAALTAYDASAGWT